MHVWYGDARICSVCKKPHSRRHAAWAEAGIDTLQVQATIDHIKWLQERIDEYAFGNE